MTVSLATRPRERRCGLPKVRVISALLGDERITAVRGEEDETGTSADLFNNGESSSEPA